MVQNFVHSQYGGILLGNELTQNESADCLHKECSVEVVIVIDAHSMFLQMRPRKGVVVRESIIFDRLSYLHLTWVAVTSPTRCLRVMVAGTKSKPWDLNQAMRNLDMFIFSRKRQSNSKGGGNLKGSSTGRSEPRTLFFVSP